MSAQEPQLIQLSLILYAILFDLPYVLSFLSFILTRFCPFVNGYAENCLFIYPFITKGGIILIIFSLFKPFEAIGIVVLVAVFFLVDITLKLYPVHREILIHVTTVGFFYPDFNHHF